MNPISEIRHIVFDWDNTLVDTSEYLKEVMDLTLHELIGKGAVLKSPLQPNYWSFKLTDLLHFSSQSLLKESKNTYSSLINERGRKDPELCEGALELVRYLKKIEKLIYVISNKYEPTLHNEVKRSGLWEYFENVIGPCEVSGVEKPSAVVFRRAFGKFISPDKVLLIGDSEIDKEAAKNFGCYFIQCGSINSHPAEAKNIQVVDLKELLNCFRKSHIGLL